MSRGNLVDDGADLVPGSEPLVQP
ncbi:hypothetical protein A2U01_0056135, partial [Trifolium medium]|nr:hypothetical protein [Trifolium medium]